MPTKNVISETVVSLSADIDNAGIQKLFGLLDQNRLKAYTLAAALAAATTGVYKFIQSVVKQEFSLEQLAKKQKKSIENTRAEQAALEAMGMTLNDIKKDKALNDIYKDLVKFNKELEMPNMKDALASVNKLRAEFWKLRSAVTYAIQRIGMQVVTDLEMPMDRIGKKMKGAAEWIRDNLTHIGMKIGGFISSFSRGVIKIGEVIGNVVEWVGNLPEGIKAVGLAIGSIFLLLKTGPLGQILALVTAIGDIQRDYENYLWNRQEGLNPGEEGYVQNLNDALGIWDIWSQDTPVADRVGQIATVLFGGLRDALNGAFRDFNMSDIFEGSSDNPGFITRVINWFNENTTLLGQVGEAIIGFIARGVREVGGTVGGVLGKVFDAVFGDGAIDPSMYEGDGAPGATFAGLVGGFIGGAIDRMKKGGSLHEIFMSGIGTGFLSMIITAFISSLKYGADGSIDWEATLATIGDSLSIVGNSIVGIFCKAIEKVDQIGSMVFGAVAKALRKTLSGTEANEALKPLSDVFGLLARPDSIFGKSISEGIVAGFVSGNGLVGIITGLARVIGEAINHPDQFSAEVEELKTALSRFFKFLWDGEIVASYENGHLVSKKHGGWLKDLVFGKDGASGLVGWLKGLWEGEDGQGGIKGWLSKLATDIGTWLEPVGSAIMSFFDSLWTRIYNKLPDWVKTMFNIQNPNQSVATVNDDGTVDVVDTRGRKANFKNYQANGDSTAKVLSDYQDLYYISDNGKDIQFRASQMYYGNIFEQLFNTSAYTEWAKVADSVWKNPDILRFMLHSLRDVMNMDDQGEAEKQLKKMALDVGKYKDDPDAMRKYITDTYGWDFSGLEDDVGKAGASLRTIGDKASIAAGSMDSLATGANHAASVLGSLQGPTPTSIGGRFNQSSFREVGEDGTEYIIPITKPNRAASLIRQMFNEMGSSAVGRIMKDFGIGVNGTLGANPSNMASALQGMSMASTYNISAPININVSSAGTDAKAVGTSIYDAAERNLIKTLRGVYA